MGRFLNSTQSDPVSAGINAYTSLTDSFNRDDAAKETRQLNAMKIQEMQREVKDRNEAREDAEKFAQLKGEKDKLDAMAEKMSNVTGMSKEQVIEIMPKVKQAMDFSKNGEDGKITPDHEKAVLKLAAATKQIPDDINNLDKHASAVSSINKFVTQMGSNLMSKPPGTYKINNKNFIDNLNIVEEENNNQGMNKFGLKAKKSISYIVVDTTKNPPASTKVYKIDSSLKDGEMFQRENKTRAFSADPENKASVIGNTDINKIPIRINVDKDGNRTVSTVRSKSFEIDGKEVLLNTISPSGKLLNDEETIEQYKKTGEHLGIFDTVQDANEAAEKLHNYKVEGEDFSKYTKRDPNDEYEAPETWMRSGKGDDAIKQKPVTLDQARFQKTEELNNLVLKMRARNPKIIEEYAEEVKQRDINKEVQKVFKNVPEGLDETKKHEWLRSNKPDGIGWKEWGEIISPKVDFQAATFELKKLELELKERREDSRDVKDDRRYELDKRKVNVLESKEGRLESGVKEDKEQKRKDSEIKLLEKYRENALKKNPGDPIFEDKIDTQVEEMTKAINSGKVRTATEAKTKVMKEGNKKEIASVNKIKALSEKFPAEKFKDRTHTDKETGIRYISKKNKLTDKYGWVKDESGSSGDID